MFECPLDDTSLCPGSINFCQLRRSFLARLARSSSFVFFLTSLISFPRRVSCKQFQKKVLNLPTINKQSLYKANILEPYLQCFFGNGIFLQIGDDFHDGHHVADLLENTQGLMLKLCITSIALQNPPVQELLRLRVHAEFE